MVTLRRLGAAVGLAAILLSGCGGDPTEAEEAGATPSASAEETPGPSPAPTPTATSEPALSATPLPTRGPGFPPEANAVHGERYHAVFVAVAPSLDDPRLTAAHARLMALGYNGGIGEIDCTPGAREGLKLKPDAEYGATSVFFDTKRQARQFVDAYDGEVVGTVHITAGCMD